MEDGSETAAAMSAPFPEMEAIASRIAVILRTVPADKCVRLTGKSLKQLRRYAAGSEPPVGVIFGLAAAADCSAGWLFLGTRSCPLDYIFEEQMLLSKLESVRSAMHSEAKTVKDIEKLKDLEVLTLKMLSNNGEMSKLDRQIERDRRIHSDPRASLRPSGARAGHPSPPQTPPIAVASSGEVDKDHSLLRIVVEVVEETLQGRHVTLVPSKKAELISLAYSVMLDERDEQQGIDKIIRLAKLAG